MAETDAAAAAQLPIGDYGMLADGRTATLVGRDGNVGWLCPPRFDSPSIFAGLLDPARGGCFQLAPRDGGLGQQTYLPGTNVLATAWGEPGRRLRLTDWMPNHFESPAHLRPLAAACWTGRGDAGSSALCRWAEALEGEVTLEAVCDPRPGYGRRAAAWRQLGLGFWHAPGSAGSPDLWAQASFPLRLAGGALRGTATVRAGSPAWFALSWGARPPRFGACGDDTGAEATAERLHGSLDATVAAWQAWAAMAQYDGPYRETVVRSALALKALIYSPTGAIVAAPTTSLPESLGGPRNWDYRYCWPRDATFALYGLSLLGYHEEAGRFLEFLACICQTAPPPLQVCYRVDGGRDVPEQELEHLAGYRGSRPVRIGNGAAAQNQLDLYGEIMDAAYTYAKWRNGLDAALWDALRPLADYAAAHWREPDESIWEVRGGPQQFVYSKVLCWVAVDRALRLAERYRLPGPLAAWRQARDEIRAAVMERGYHAAIGSFTQTFDNDVLDSSLLLLPLLRFVTPDDPRMLSTLARIQQRLSRNSLVARYENTQADGVGGPEGAFSICTFWLVDCLTLVGRTAESRRLFERMLGHAGPLGLFAEEMDPATGAMLGNYPQGFTHMALLNSAHNLELYPQGVRGAAAGMVESGR